MNYVVGKYQSEDWSLDACYGYAVLNNLFDRTAMVCTKTLYNYIDAGLMAIKNIDLPMKLCRNTKQKRVRQNKKNLGKSIEERPETIKTRKDFGHWEIDTVIGSKSGSDEVLMTPGSYIKFVYPSKTAKGEVFMPKMSKKRKREWQFFLSL